MNERCIYENYLSLFLKAVTDLDLFVVFEEELVKEQLNWLQFRLNDGFIFGIDHNLHVLKEDFAYLACTNLARSSGYDLLFEPLIENRSQASQQKKIYRFNVFSTNSLKYCGYLDFISFSDSLVSVEHIPTNTEILNIHNCSSEFYLHGEMTKNYTLQNAFYSIKNSFHKELKQIYLKKNKSNFVYLNKEELSMKESNTVIVDILLGSLEMSLDDFTKIRKGEELNFSLPEEQEVILRLGNCDWATAQISKLGTEEPLLKLNKLVSIENLTNQEQLSH